MTKQFLFKYKITHPIKRWLTQILDAVLNFIFIRKAISYKEPHKLLIIRLDNLGDILLTRPLVYSLKKAYPQVSIDILLSKESVNILKFDSWITNIFFINKETITQLKNNRYDLIIEPKGRLDYAWLTYKLKPNFSIGFGDAGGRAFFNEALYQIDQNPIEKNKQICNKLNITYNANFPDINVGDTLLEPFQKYSSFILIMPFSSRKEKDWSGDNYLHLITALKKSNIKVVVAGEFSRKEDFSAFINCANIELFSSEQLYHLVALIKSVKLLVGPDSAPIHIAAAVRTNTLSLYLKEAPSIWHHYKEEDGHYVLHSPTKEITVEDVEIKILSILGEDFGK